MNVQTIIAIGTAVRELVAAAISAREKARQSEEWTVAQEEAFDLHIAQQIKEAHWLPDPPQG